MIITPPIPQIEILTPRSPLARMVGNLPNKGSGIPLPPEFSPTNYFLYESGSNNSIGILPDAIFLTPFDDPVLGEQRGYCVADATAPDNSGKILRFSWEDQVGEKNYGMGGMLNNVVVANTGNCIGSWWYLGCFIRIIPVGASAIYSTGIGVEEFDKHLEMEANGMRWVVNTGARTNDNMASTKFSCFLTNPAGNGSNGHLTGLEVNDSIFQNTGGYSRTDPYELSYNTWYPLVMGIYGSQTTTGSIRFWLNKTLVISHDNVVTVDPLGSGTIEQEWTINGTVGQPPSPATPQENHYRDFSGLLGTDDSNELITWGYLDSV